MAVTAADTYGRGELHDWYLIILALVVLFLVMRYFPRWGIPLGFVILLGAVISTPTAVDHLKRLVNIVQTGSLGGFTTQELASQPVIK